MITKEKQKTKTADTQSSLEVQSDEQINFFIDKFTNAIKLRLFNKLNEISERFIIEQIAGIDNESAENHEENKVIVSKQVDKTKEIEKRSTLDVQTDNYEKFVKEHISLMEHP